MPYLFLSGHHQVLDNFVIHYKMNCLFLPKFALAWERDIDISIQFFILIGGCRLGDVVDNESQMFYKFEDAKWYILSNFVFIWDKLQDIYYEMHAHHNIIVAWIFANEKTGAPWVDWLLKDDLHLLQVITNILYYHTMC